MKNNKGASKSSKIPKPKLNSESGRIDKHNREILSGSNNCVFSFRFLKEDGDKFRYTNLNSDYFSKLLERMHDVSSMSANQLRNSSSDALRCHRIDWKKDNVSEDGFGILGDDGFYDDHAWQMSISSNKYGRIHGFFDDNVFYVVWLDKNHNLYHGNN